MNWLPSSLWARLVLAFAFGVGGVAVLHTSVVARERELAERQPRRAATNVATAPTSALDTLGFPLREVAGTVLLVSRVEAIAPDVAPVLQVFLDGSVALRRAASAATGPLVGAAAVNREGVGAALVVPRGRAADWTAAARVAAAEVLGRWIGERPVPLGRVRDVDLGWAPADLARFLAWVP